MNVRNYVILCITSILLLIPIAGATYDVVSNISSNSTEYTTSSSYGELHNISLATGAGTTFLTASWDARMNFTAPLYGRFLRDGVSLGRFNLTQSVYAQVGSYELAFNETIGTHQYGWEVYSNKKGTIYSRNFSAFFLVNGSYGEVSSTYNATYDAYQALITVLQSNDTADRTYVNDTFLPITTYAGNFPNTTIANLNGNYPNSSLVNYLLISTYSGNFPNATVASNLAAWNATYNATYDAKVGWTQALFDTAFHTEIPVCNATTGKLVSDDGETVTCGTDQTGAAGGNVSSVTAQSPLTYTGTIDVVIKDERTTYPNNTISGNLLNWNATYNSSYAYGGFDVLFSNGSDVLATGTKAHVKAKYAGTLTDLTAHSVETGSINISAYNLTLGTYIGSVVITAGTDGSTSGLSYAFAKGDWLNLTISSVTSIKQVTAAVQTTKS